MHLDFLRFRGRLPAVAVFVLFTVTLRAQVPQQIREVTPRDAAAMIGQYRGSVVMFHIYASWCGPCIREFPMINQLGTLYGTKGFVLLAFSADDDPDMLKRFLGNNPLSFSPMRLVASAPDDMIRAVQGFGGTYRNAIPYTAIFDRSGSFIQEWTGANSGTTYARVIEPLLRAEGPRISSSSPPAAMASPTPSGLRFTLREHPLFKIAQKKPSFYLLTKDGRVTEGATADPYFLAGGTYAKNAIGDRRRFAEERLRATGSTSSITILETNELTVDDISGFEFVAEAKDTDLNAPVVVYHTMLFDESRYFLMQGFTPADQKSRNIPAFREIARSFHRQ